MLNRSLKWLAISILSAVSMFGAASAVEYGTISDAKALLDRAVKEIKANKEEAIAKFNHNEAPFRDRDLFVFCFGSRDGKFTAHEAFVNHDVRQLRDGRGRPFGDEMYSTAKTGAVVEIDYVAALPGTTSLVLKRALITQVADQVCGVSAYVLTGPTN